MGPYPGYALLLLVCQITQGCLANFARVQDFQETQKQLAEDFSRAVEERISKAANNQTNFPCECVYHECGASFDSEGTCIRSSPTADNFKCPTDEKSCSIRKVGFLVMGQIFLGVVESFEEFNCLINE